MSATFHTAGGGGRVHRPGPGFNLRLLAFGLTLALGVSLVVWVQAGVGRQMAQVQREFGAIVAEGFYVGVSARTHFRKLNDTCLSLHLKGPVADRAEFLREARQLKEWLRGREATLNTPPERELFHRVEAAYLRYLANVETLLDGPDAPAARASFATTYERLMEFSAPVLEAVGQFVQAQQTAFDGFLRDWGVGSMARGVNIEWHGVVKIGV